MLAIPHTFACGIDRPLAAALFLLLLRGLQGLLGTRLLRLLLLLVLLARCLGTSRRPCGMHASRGLWRPRDHMGWRRLATELCHLVGREGTPCRQLGKDLV